MYTPILCVGVWGGCVWGCARVRLFVFNSKKWTDLLFEDVSLSINRLLLKISSTGNHLNASLLKTQVSENFCIRHVMVRQLQ